MLGPMLSPGDTKRNKMEKAEFEVREPWLKSWFNLSAAMWLWKNKLTSLSFTSLGPLPRTK